MDWKLDSGWKSYNKIGTVSYRGQSKFFRFCEKTIPYLPLIFKDKRQRVKCRQYFRYHWWRKCEKEITDILLNATAKPVDWGKIELNLPEYWEITKNASC